MSESFLFKPPEGLAYAVQIDGQEDGSHYFNVRIKIKEVAECF